MTPDPASESNKPPFEPGTKVLIRLWDLETNLSSGSGKALSRLFFIIPHLSWCQELIFAASRRLEGILRLDAFEEQKRKIPVARWLTNRLTRQAG